MNKYQIWHDQIIDRARSRKPLGCYSETHHILPRSLGGGDEQTNLIDLTYREHFLIHWILTRINTGGRLRKMQRALFAMTLQVNKKRQTLRWQFEIARRVVSDLAIDPVMEAAWRKNYAQQILMKQDVIRKKEAHWVRARVKIREENRRLVHESVASKSKIEKSELNQLTNLFLKHSEKPKVKYSFRPRRVMGPNGVAISRQKLKAKQKLALANATA